MKTKAANVDQSGQGQTCGEKYEQYLPGNADLTDIVPECNSKSHIFFSAERQAMATPLARASVDCGVEVKLGWAIEKRGATGRHPHLVLRILF